MAWPADMTTGPQKGEMFIGGAWVDVTSRIRGSENVRIERGRRDIQGSALMPPTVCDFTLNNGDGAFTDDNPLSPYFELIPLFTPFRFSVQDSGMDHYMYLPGHDSIDYARTPDKALVDITGDIDIRLDIAPTSWQPPHYDPSNDDKLMVLASKTGDTATQFSWFLALRTDGRLFFNWSTNGNRDQKSGVISLLIPNPTERMSVRVALDVDNGAGGHTLDFFTGPSTSGPWTNIGTFTGSGVTSVFNGTGYVEVGSGWLGGGVYGGNSSKTYSGKIYAFELRNGINGTLVANANFRTQPIGTTLFSDGLGNTWEVRNGGLIVSDEIRFWGEIETLPQEWDPSGKDMFSRVHAQDLLARLNTKQEPVSSPIYNNRMALDPTGYWPFEDGSDSTQASAASKDTVPAVATNVRFQATDDLPGSDGAAQFAGDGAFVRGRPRTTPLTGTASALVFFKFGTMPTAGVPLISFTTTATNVQWWRIESNGTSFTVRAFDQDGTSLVNSTISMSGAGITMDPKKWMGIRLELTTNGGLINWAVAWHQVGSKDFLGGSGTITGTVGRFTGFTMWADGGNNDMYFAHVWIDTSLVDFVSDEFRNSANGYIGELYGTRFLRICKAAGITPDIDGYFFDTSPVGRQPIDTPLRILQDGADVDGGLLTSSRRRGNTLTYITRGRIQTAPKAVTLQHNTLSHLAETPKPVKDSVGVRNDVTVTRRGGSSSRVVMTDGRFGTNAIGRVPAQETYNPASDAQTEAIAGWLAALGSLGEYRFPNITVALNRPQTLLGSAIGRTVMGLDIGRYVEIDKLPAGQAPGPYEQILQGYSEIISNKTYVITFNGTSYTAWRAGVIENGIEPIRFGDTDTTVSATVNTTATTILFKTPDTTDRWITSADSPPAGTFPMDVMIGGEWVRVSNITGTTASGGFYTQTATVLRSINGVVKSQTAGTKIKLRRVLRFGR